MQKDTSFSKQVVLVAWKSKNTILKYPNKQEGETTGGGEGVDRGLKPVFMSSTRQTCMLEKLK